MRRSVYSDAQMPCGRYVWLSRRGAESGFGPPAKGTPVKSLYTKPERLSVAEWLELGLKGLICIIDRQCYYREKQKHMQHNRAPDSLLVHVAPVICTVLPLCRRHWFHEDEIIDYVRLRIYTAIRAPTSWTFSSNPRSSSSWRDAALTARTALPLFASDFTALTAWPTDFRMSARGGGKWPCVTYISATTAPSSISFATRGATCLERL
jgi:hypothetical protein